MREQRNYGNDPLIEMTDRFLGVDEDGTTYNYPISALVAYLNNTLDFTGGQGVVNVTLMDYGNNAQSIVDIINSQNAITIAQNQLAFFSRTDSNGVVNTLLFRGNPGQYGGGQTFVTEGDFVLINRAVTSASINHNLTMNYVQDEHILPDGVSLVIENQRLIVKQVNGHTVASDVPANAVFTDTQTLSDNPTNNNSNIGASTVATNVLNTNISNHISNISNPHNVLPTQIPGLQVFTSQNVDVSANSNYRNVGHIPMSLRGADDGVAPLDSNGLIPSQYIAARVQGDYTEVNPNAASFIRNKPSDVTILSLHSTDELPEGSNNLYFTSARVSANANVVANTALRTEIESIGNENVLFKNSSGNIAALTANTGFNKNFGVVADTVAQGNDSRFLTSVQKTALTTGINADGQHIHGSAGLPNNVAYTDASITWTGASHTFNGDVIVQGNFVRQPVTNLEVFDNVVLLNSGEGGIGVSSQLAGIQIDRGALDDIAFLFDESDDMWKIGTFNTITDTVVNATPTTITFNEQASAVDGFYNGMLMRVFKEDETTQVRTVINYDGITKTATLNTAWTNIPDTTWNYRIVTASNLQKVWHEGNDGAGSGLDADLLDGRQGSDYALADDVHRAVAIVGQNYLTLSGQEITANPVNLHTHTVGVLPISRGGTGAVDQNFVDITTDQTIAGTKTWMGLNIFNGGLNAQEDSNNAPLGLRQNSANIDKYLISVNQRSIFNAISFVGRNIKETSGSETTQLEIQTMRDGIVLPFTFGENALSVHRIQIREGNPASGKILTSDDNGLASWQDAPSGGATYTSGTGIDISASNIVSHADTSSATSTVVESGVFVNRVSVDEFGHITALNTQNINTIGALSNVAYTGQDNDFSVKQTFNTALDSIGVTGLFNGGLDSTNEVLRIGRSDDTTIRYHSLFSVSSATQNNNSLSLRLHNAADSTSQKEVVNITPSTMTISVDNINVGQGKITASNVFNPSVQTLTGTTVTLNASNGVNAQITLTANASLTFTNLVAGMSGNIKVTQDSTGNRTLTILNTNVEIAGGDLNLTGTGGSRDIIGWYYDGTTILLALGLNFS